MFPKLLSAIFLLIHTIAFASPTPSFRVINGKDANIENYPFVVSLRDQLGQHICGGSILNNIWILTAAHCVVGLNPLEFSVQVGRTRIFPSVDDTIYFISKVLFHPFYDPVNNLLHDIAMVKLKAPLIFSPNVQPVVLPERWMDDTIFTNVTAIGWGQRSEDGPASTTLQQVHHLTVPNSRCNAYCNGQCFVYPSQICGDFHENDMALGKGDSGGPLISNGVQLGIASWVINQSPIHNAVAVYTKVSFYIDFINYIIVHY